MNTRKYNAARKACHYGDRTFADILEVLSQHTSLGDLTGKQIGEICNAMYQSSENGRAAMFDEMQ